MTALAIIITVSVVVGLLAFALVDLAAHDEQPHGSPPPTVDGGWRAFQ